MRVRRGTSALVVIAGAIACTAPATAAGAPVANAYYAGTAPGAERPAFVRVAASGRHLSSYQFAVRITCADGVSRSFGLNEFREKRFGVTADGRFDFQSTETRFAAGEGRSRLTGRGSVRVAGTFAGDTATATVRYRFAARTTCDQDIPLTLTRVGSPALPGGDSVMNTGTFRRLRGDTKGLSIPAFRAIGPARLVENLRIGWRGANCTRRFTYRDSFAFVPLLLTADGELDLPVRERYRFPRGYRVRLRARLTLEFTREIYQATWTATSKLYRRGRHVSTCRFPRTHFSGIVDGA